MQFLRDDDLERSSVVANCCMNRERSLAGSNGYARELGFNPLTLLMEKVASANHVRWLDLCCGSGTALIEAAQVTHNEGLAAQVEIVGVDLVGMFAHHRPDLKCLQLVEASLSTWQPEQRFDLITCVHGLHYVGDKLGLIKKAVSWLVTDGRFAANLDLKNLKLQDGRSATRRVATELRRNGLQFDSRRKRISCSGGRRADLPFHYLGADDQAGPNYTGQAAVDSYYEHVAETPENG